MNTTYFLKNYCVTIPKNQNLWYNSISKNAQPRTSERKHDMNQAPNSYPDTGYMIVKVTTARGAIP